MIAALDVMPAATCLGTLLVTDRDHDDHDELVDAVIDHDGYVLSRSGTYRVTTVVPGERWSWVLRPVRPARA